MKTTEEVQQLKDESKCLVCHRVRKTLRRGLCTEHYEKFRRQREKLPANQHDSFEEMLISKGLLLPSRQGQRNVENVFADELAKFLASKDPNTGASLLAEVERIQAERGQPPKEPGVKPRRKKKA